MRKKIILLFVILIFGFVSTCLSVQAKEISYYENVFKNDLEDDISIMMVGCEDGPEFCLGDGGGGSTTYYTITFNSNGGTPVSSITKAAGTTVTKPKDPTKTDHTFAGLYSDSNLTQEYTFTTMPSHSITLYAKWYKGSYIYLTDSFNKSDVYTQENGTEWGKTWNYCFTAPSKSSADYVSITVFTGNKGSNQYKISIKDYDLNTIDRKYNDSKTKTYFNNLILEPGKIYTIEIEFNDFPLDYDDEIYVTISLSKENSLEQLFQGINDKDYFNSPI